MGPTIHIGNVISGLVLSVCLSVFVHVSKVPTNIVDRFFLNKIFKNRNRRKKSKQPIYNQGNKLSGNYEERRCRSYHKKFKTLFREHMVRLKIISLYMHKDLKLKT